MRRFHRHIAWLVLVLTSLHLPACPAALDDRCGGGACTRDSARTDASPTPSLAPALPISGDSCALSDTYADCIDSKPALYVSAATAAAPSADGTREHPFPTITSALRASSLSSSATRRIYVCAGRYEEDLQLDAAHESITVMGGLSCDWKPVSGLPRIGKSTQPLQIRGASGVTLARLAFEAADATMPGESSITAVVDEGSVFFHKVALSSGRGAPGQAGALAPYTLPSTEMLKGYDATSSVAAPQKKVVCPGPEAPVTIGGAGGIGGTLAESGMPGAPNLGTNDDCTIHRKGGGAGSSAQASDAPAVMTSHGSLSSEGWTPQGGHRGLDGHPGQGGGGGGTYQASTIPTPSGLGGGGGTGGCGGAGGGGGGGGGASIAVSALHSQVVLQGCSLTTRESGQGGEGAAGQVGSPGGVGGLAVGLSCVGGRGGYGGVGTAGGGGAGGISVGVVYKGKAPFLDAATQSQVTLGLARSGGTSTSTPGIDGVSAQILEVP